MRMPGTLRPGGSRLPGVSAAKILFLFCAPFFLLQPVTSACHELQKTDKPVDKIREEVGFETASTFNRNFKKLVNMSPNEWRAKKQKKANYHISIYKGW